MKKSLGERLKDLRNGRSQAEIANEIGVSGQSWSFYERNEKKPTLETIGSICKFFNVSADWLLGVSEDVQAEPPKRALSNVSASGGGEKYWRELAISQQATIAQLVSQLAEGRASVAAPVKTGGHAAIKTA